MKKLRVFYTDPDATDSSSSDEDDKIPGKPTTNKRFYRELTIDTGDNPHEKPTVQVSSPQKMVKKYPGVRKWPSGRYSAEIHHPINKAKLWLGTFDSPEEAYEVYCWKKLELEALKREKNRNVDSQRIEKVGVVERINSGKCGDDLKSRSGSYDGVKETESEFDERVVVKERLLSDLYSDERTLCGVGVGVGDGDGKSATCIASYVECLGDGKWEGRVWNPELKCLVSAGVYDVRTKAQFAVRSKELSLWKRFGSETGGKADGVGYDRSDVTIGLPAPRLSKEEIAQKRKYVNWVRKGSIGGKGEGTEKETSNSKLVEAISGTAELAPGPGVCDSKKRKRASNPSSPKKAVCQTSYGSPTSVLDIVNEDHQTLINKVNTEVYDSAFQDSTTSALDLGNKDHDTLINKVNTEVDDSAFHNSPTWAFKRQKVTNEDVSVCKIHGIDCTFDGLVKAGIMNEYGQLLGEYSKLDEPMWLTNHDHDEDEAN